MDLKILIATPDLRFGEDIAQALQEANYVPLLVSSTAEAAFIVQDEKCPIAILDCELPDPGPAYLASELRARFSDLRIIFVHPGEDRAELIEINPTRDIDLPRPFFLPDLLEVIHLWVAESRASMKEAQPLTEPQAIPSELAWLQDVNRAAQYLTRLSLEVDAQAALIIQNARIWAYAGQLSQTAAKELAQFVGHHWAYGKGDDLARFVRLETTGSEYMLYATSLGSGFVLALSFRTELPFSKMRAQTGELARKLTSPLPETPLENLSESIPEVSPEYGGVLTEEYEWVPEVEDEIDSIDEEEEHVDEVLIERQKAMFDDLLATLDIPDPDGSRSPQSVQTKTAPTHTVELHHKEPKTIHPETSVEPPTVLERTPTQDSDPLTKSDVQLVSESFALHDLAYSCILIPRLPTHHLTGILTGFLNVEIARLCLAFGWSLDHLAIRPEYLHWVVSVTPDVPASQVIQKIREQTSAQIFNEFPRLEKENPSGDFWAPGFMVVHGRRPLAGTLVQDYIRNTRTRQGIDHT